MVEYSEAPEVQEIADKLIPEFHPHLVDEAIEYIFRDSAASRGDKVILGMARKVRGLTSYLSRKTKEPYFVMEIAEDMWATLDDAKKKALVDHELCHFGINENGDRFIAPHDIEEFAAVIERHGMWMQGILA